MILKIERYREGERFWLVDKVNRIASSIRLEYKNEEDIKEVIASNPDAILLDLPMYGCDSDSGNLPPDYRVCVIKCRMENGNDYCILFDTVAYVLNDNGKTIEKIVVNYKV